MDFRTALHPRKIWAGVVRRARAYADSAVTLSQMRKVKAHQVEHAAELEDQKWSRLANGWADEEAKAARQRHPQPSNGERAEAEQAWQDAVAACHVLARATLLWPAGSGKDTTARQRRATTRHGRRLEAEARTAHRAQERRLRARAAWDTHKWVHTGAVQRCAVCLCRAPEGRSRMEPCQGPPPRVADLIDAAEAGGHRTFRGLLGEVDGAGPQQALYMCVACGAWTAAVVQPRCRLWGPCRGSPTASAAEALRRVRSGRHPKAGRTPSVLHAFRPL